MIDKQTKRKTFNENSETKSLNLNMKNIKRMENKDSICYKRACTV